MDDRLFGRDEGETAVSPFDPTRDRSVRLSRRGYNLLMGGLVMFGFFFIAACGALVDAPGFLSVAARSPVPLGFVFTAVSIGGVLVLHGGMRREGFGMALAGYALLVCSIGFTTGFILSLYDLPSIASAFVGTALIAALFTLLGAAYPAFFARVHGILIAALLALFIVGIVGSFMGVSMGWLDYAVILVFCGFIGYDTYRAQQCEATVKMAIFNAARIWLDLVNVFIRVLAIVGRRR